jgi:ParB family chromosome partitioning protein
MTIQMIPARNCVLSKTNVRRTAANPTLLAQLKADIAARGVLQNLIGFGIPKKTGKFEITAGGRRLASVHELIGDGSLPKDYAIPVLVLNDSSNASETSLAENYQRQPMNPADECTAFRHFIDVNGASPEDVAKRFGVTTRFVEGRIRLAGLAPSVFEALRDGAISLDAAQAYGTTSDTDRQEAVFEQMSRSYNRHDANIIRRMMTDETISGEHRLAKLVGRDAYLAAGGRIEADLFAQNADEIWLDSALVASLAAEKMEAAAAALGGFGTVVTVLDGRPAWDQTQTLRPIRAERIDPTEAERERLAAIEAELDAIEEAADEEGLTDEESDRVDALNEEAAAIENKTADISDEAKASATAFLVVDADGNPRLFETVYVDPAAVRVTADGGALGGRPDAGKENEEPGLGKVLRDELAVQRTQLLALHVASDPATAVDLAIFLLADKVAGNNYCYDRGSTLSGEAPSRAPFGFKPEGAAVDQLQAFHAGLDHSWSEHRDTAARFDAFRALDADKRGAWAGWTVSRTLEATLLDEKSAGLQNHLGRALGIDVATWWRPTAVNFFGRIRKPAILDTLAEIGGPEMKSRYASAKKGDIAAAAEKICSGTAIVAAGVRAAALAWVPIEMRYTETVAIAEGAGGNPDVTNYPAVDVDVSDDTVLTADPVDQAA